MSNDLEVLQPEIKQPRKYQDTVTCLIDVTKYKCSVLSSGTMERKNTISQVHKLPGQWLLVQCKLPLLECQSPFDDLYLTRVIEHAFVQKVVDAIKREEPGFFLAATKRVEYLYNWAFKVYCPERQGFDLIHEHLGKPFYKG